MTSWQPPDRPNLPAVTGVRFFAAIHVCLYHLAQAAFFIKYDERETKHELIRWATDVWSIFDANWVSNHILRGALCQVGMFFVMSGFVLTYSHPVGPNGEFSYRSYWLSRFSRVYATYFAGLVWGIILLYVVISGSLDQLKAEQAQRPIINPLPSHTESGMEIRRLPPEFTLSTTEKIVGAISVPLLLQAWYPKFSVYLWNPPAWSLSVEAFLYLIFPFLIIPLMKWTTRSLIILAGFCWIAMLIPPLWYYFTDPDHVGFIDWNMIQFWFNFVRHFPLFRVPEFVMGMVIGRLVADKAAANARAGIGTGAWMSMSALVIVILTMAFAENIFGHGLAYILLHNGLLAPVFAIGVAGLALGGGPLAYFCSFKWMVVLGDCAYGIYLYHFPYLAYTIPMLHKKAENSEKLPGAWEFIITYLVITVLSAVFFRTKLEKRMRLKIRDWAAKLWPAPKQA